jgi:hypothetical protein
MMGISPKDEARFWPKLDKRGETECWLWLAGKNRVGYGWFTIGRKNKLAHRIAWAIANSRDPGRLVVMHTCDNPPCCNPAHLRLGTIQENVADMVAKGRALQGTRSPYAKLTAEQVIEIRKAKASYRAQAAQYGVGMTTIKGVRTGRTYTNV